MRRWTDRLPSVMPRCSLSSTKESSSAATSMDMIPSLARSWMTLSIPAHSSFIGVELPGVPRLHPEQGPEEGVDAPEGEAHQRERAGGPADEAGDAARQEDDARDVRRLA